jgi:endonuclease/exonuclease/phosphatase (EEP) superfamily protein YafD
MSFLEPVLLALGGFSIVATAATILRTEVWWIRIFDFLRLQVLLIAVFTLAVYLLTADEIGTFGTIFAAALGLSLVWQGYMMFPYTPLAKVQVQRSVSATEHSTISLLVANVLESNRNSERLIEIVRDADPDIFLAMETDQWWLEQLKQFEETHPFVVRKPLDNTYGMLLYSRLELIDPEVKFLVREGVPSIHGRLSMRSGMTVELRCLHPPPPFPTEDESSVSRDAELVIVGKECEGNPSPFIVMGDLNDVAWSHTNYLFQDISGLLDPRIGRGFFHTFHAKYPFLRFPLDHFFHSNHFRLVEFKRLGYFGSDHFPVYIKLSLEADAAAEQEELEASLSQKSEAEEKVVKAANKA